MKKAKVAIATYRNNHIYNLQIVNCKGEFITLISYDPVDVAQPYKDSSFKGMLTVIITIAKNNGYEIEHHACFGTTFYNISLINLDDKRGLIDSSWSFNRNNSEQCWWCNSTSWK